MMNPLQIHLNHQTNRWEFRDGRESFVAFSYVGQGYFTDSGEPLGARWDDARKKAEEIAERRRSRMILEKAR